MTPRDMRSYSEAVNRRLKGNGVQFSGYRASTTMSRRARIGGSVTGGSLPSAQWMLPQPQTPGTGVPNGIRTRVAAVKGRCPRPLDDGDACRNDGASARVARRRDTLVGRRLTRQVGAAAQENR